MRHFFTVLGHELRMLLVSPSTYIAAVLFLLLMGFVFTGILESYTSSASEISPAGQFFKLFWLPVFFMVPLLTMKCISEERRQGTLENLLTSPVSTAEVVLGKYAAAYGLYAALWAATGGFFYILTRFTPHSHFIDTGALAGGYLFIAASGAFYIAIGVFASSLSRNQAVAGILAFSLLFAVIVGTKFAATLPLMKLDSMAAVRSALEYTNTFRHLEDFSDGIVDVREIFYYLSGASLALIFSILGIEAKLLHS